MPSSALTHIFLSPHLDDAALSCGGGNSTNDAGGNGGAITLTSSVSPSSHMSITAPGGTGTPAGTPGTITVDGNVL